MARFPPDPDEIIERLYRIIKPPPPPWLVGRWREEADARREALGLPPPLRCGKRARVLRGSKMVWPFRLTWEQSESGRGTITVLKDEKTIGRVSYLDVAERQRLLGLLEAMIKGGGQ